MPRGHVKQDGPPSRRTVWTGRAGRPFCRGGTETARGAAGEPRAAGGRREAGGKGGPGPRGGHEPGALGGRWARQRAAGRAALCSPRPTTRRGTSSALRTHPQASQRWHVLRPRSKPVCARIYIRAAGPRARPHAGGDSTETPAAKLSGRAHAVWRLRAVTEQTRRGRTLSGPRRGQGGQPGHGRGGPVTPARPGICPRQTGGGDSAANPGPEVSTGRRGGSR